MVKSQKVIFQKPKTAQCSPSELHTGGLFTTFNSDVFNINGGLCNRRIGFCLQRTSSPGGEQFL